MKLSEQREAAGVTQAEVSHYLGVTVATISRWENGKNKPHKSFLKRIERFYAAKAKELNK